MAANPAQGPNRRRTTFAQSSAQAYAALRRRVTKDWAAAVKEPPESPHAGLYPHYFSVYNINWEKLKAWLERRFPDEKFKKELANNVKLRTMTDDNYVCYTPDPLTELEVEDIKESCTEPPPASSRDRGQSPEMRA